MNVRILFASRSKYSEKVARAIGEALKIPVYHIEENPDLTEVDLVFFVAGMFDGNSDPDLLQYIKKQKDKFIKKAAFISTIANTDDRQVQAAQLLKQKNVELVGENVCLSQMLFLNLFHPNKNDIERSLQFVRTTLGLPKYG